MGLVSGAPPETQRLFRQTFLGGATAASARDFALQLGETPREKSAFSRILRQVERPLVGLGSFKPPI
jgi:hypothetical protein